ncbi:hypothetical protein [Dysgonomonas sp. ZJ709]|uniref:hypothetical protein n=1 Tax=Dysgonomonas sp. ZJ709 TaxID=2709797 RepID=UPI0013ED1FD4|nr:hypothetical protein [Dysgonomonas sp. ZJ709]
MINDKEYTVTDLYLRLKLDIWRSGRVARWGHVKKVDIQKDNSTSTAYYIPKPLNSYNSFSLAKQLATGLYLLDLHLVKRDVWNKQLVYIAIIAICRSTMAQIQTIHCLQVTNSLELGIFRNLITDNPAQASMRKRKSPFRVSKTPRTFNASPINATPRRNRIENR